MKIDDARSNILDNELIFHRLNAKAALVCEIGIGGIYMNVKEWGWVIVNVGDLIINTSEVKIMDRCFELNKNHHLHLEDEYRSMPLVGGDYPMIAEYLEVLDDVMQKALLQYGKVFAFRFDLRMPVDVEADPRELSNVGISRFIESLKAKIRHNREAAKESSSLVHDTKVRYFWVREVGERGRVHYHCVVLLNGHAFNWLGNYQSARGNMANRVREAWASTLGETMERAVSLMHFPENPSYILFRNNPESIQVFFQRASYLCKAWTKQYGFGHHGYGSSRD